LAKAYRAVSTWATRRLFQAPADLVETGFGAALVKLATWRTADADRANGLGAEFYFDRPLRQQHVRQLGQAPADGVGPTRCAMAPLVSSLRAAPSVSTV